MIEVLKNSIDKITVSEKEFNVISYKIQHSKNNTKQFTVSGDTYVFSKGLNPVILSVKAGSKLTDNSVIIALETALTSASANNFEINSISYTNMILQDYTAEKDKNGFISNIDMTFISADNISAVAEELSNE